MEVLVTKVHLQELIVYIHPKNKCIYVILALKVVRHVQVTLQINVEVATQVFIIIKINVIPPVHLLYQSWTVLQTSVLILALLNIIYMIMFVKLLAQLGPIRFTE